MSVSIGALLLVNLEDAPFLGPLREAKNFFTLYRELFMRNLRGM